MKGFNPEKMRMLYSIVMPTKNVAKILVPNSYYHVYNRGWNKGNIFFDSDDYAYFEKLLAVRLGRYAAKDGQGREYPHYYPGLKLNAYCLMKNHYHMLVHQGDDATRLSSFISGVIAAYTAYFNKKYKRRGSLFESSYKAVNILGDQQFMHITRYIHLNHADYSEWRHSSYRDYATGARDWIHPEDILELFPSVDQYIEFVKDYEDIQRERDEIKHGLYGA